MSDMDDLQANSPRTPLGRGDGLIGKTLGQFTIVQEVGRGGMATVYKATQKSINRQVAVKVLPRHFMHDPGFLERFEREVKVISGLEHPHILPIYDYGESDGVPYIAMRFLSGGSMAQMVQRGVSNLTELEKPFQQIGEALDYAHQQGIIHRDLKPGNIMLDEHGNAYLSDFGIARVMGSDLTGSAIIGTPAYMSPEQAQGGNIDARSDIYALGVVLFELITGTEPFQAETPMSMMLKHLNEPLPPLDRFRSNLPDDLQVVIDTATAKSPDDRYPSASVLAQALATALSENTLAPQNSSPTPSNAAMTGLPATNEPNTDPDKTPKRNAIPLAVVAALLVGGLIVVAVVLSLGNFSAANTAPATVTPFRGAMIVSDVDYRLSLPEAWIFTDQSNVRQLLHSWQAPDGSVRAELAIVDSGERSIESYSRVNFQNAMMLIDETTAEDGTIRRSYRVENHPELDNGQLDAFFTVEPERLVVFTVYTADAIATDTVTLETLQLMLDSLNLTQ